jgi:aspartate aminotransferase
MASTRAGNKRNHARAPRPPEINLNLNVRGLPASATLRINERSDAMRAQGVPVIKLGLGQSPFPVPEPVVEELRAHAGEKAYLPVRGLPALREAVARHLERRQGVMRSPEDVLIGPGSKELMFLLQLVYYGDLVVPTPAWVSYAPQARIVGRQVRFLETSELNHWRLSPDDLARLCQEDPGRPRITILNYPSNPTGASYTVEELRALAQVAREFRVVLLSDEIYGELHHTGRHVSIARFYPEGTIVSSGLSKWCGAGGWRLGTFVFPPSLRWLLDAMASVASETYTSTSAPIQFAAVRAFEGGLKIERYLTNARRVLAGLGRWTAKTLRRAGVACDNPTGAFYLFPDFAPHRETLTAAGITTAEQMCARLLEEANVALLPGSEFGRPERELTARLAYVDFDGARALADAESRPGQVLDEEFLRAHCHHVMQAVEAVCAWVSAL